MTSIFIKLSLTEDANTIPFSIIFNTFQSVYNKHIYPSNIFNPISQVLLAFLTKLEDLNNLRDEPKFLPSVIPTLHGLDSYFEVPNLEQLRSIKNNPHHLLGTDSVQLKQFQYHIFHNINLNDQTIPQIRIYSLIRREFSRFNYQLRWNDQDQTHLLTFLVISQMINYYHLCQMMQINILKK